MELNLDREERDDQWQRVWRSPASLLQTRLMLLLWASIMVSWLLPFSVPAEPFIPKNDNWLVLQRGQLIWPCKMATCLPQLICPLKRATGLSLKQGNWFVSQRTTDLSLKKSNSFVPQKGQLVCPLKRTINLSLKKGNFFVPQKGQLVCSLKRETNLFLKKDNWFVPQNGK